MLIPHSSFLINRKRMAKTSQQLKQLAAQNAAKTAKESISAHDVFDLMKDIVDTMDAQDESLLENAIETAASLDEALAERITALEEDVPEPVPVATPSVAGTVKIGTDFDVAQDGTISLYKTPSIDSFSISPSLKEVGETVTAVTPTFTLNKTMATVTINGTAATSGTAITGSWTQNTDFTLRVVDARGTEKTRTEKLTFGKKAYVGTNANELTATSANITGLASSAIKTAKNYGAFTTSAVGYIYYAIPDAWDTPTYKDSNNLTGTFNKIGTVNVTAHGVTTLYALYRTVYQIPASTTINIQ